MSGDTIHPQHVRLSAVAIAERFLAEHRELIRLSAWLKANDPNWADSP